METPGLKQMAAPSQPTPTQPGPSWICQAIRLCGYEPLVISPRQSGYRNHSYRVTTPDGPTLNFIIYKREPHITSRIRRANLVSDYLWTRGFPARHTVTPRIICLRSDRADRYGCLYEYLPGTTIAWESYTRAHLKLLGATMSDMHAALRACPASDMIRREARATTEYTALLDRIERYFNEPSVKRAALTKLGVVMPQGQLQRFRTALEICDRLPHQQVIHMDYVRGNILFENSATGPRLSGILDFEKTAYGSPVLDIARTLAFLLVDSKYKTEPQVRHNLLNSGYNKRSASQFRTIRIHSGNRSIDLLEELLTLCLFHDFYKFLRHNPYESLAQNEHYVRTLSALRQRRAICANRFASTRA